MARITEVKFGDFQVQKRYKELERELKLASLRQKSTTNKSLPSLLSHTSNNYVDSSNGAANDNDIVSSSKNLKNIFSRKGFSTQSDTQKNYLIMQPPNSHVIPRTSKKRNDTLIYNAKVSPMSQNNRIPSYLEFNRKKQNFELSNTTKQHTNSVNFSQISAGDSQIKNVKIFIKWKVMLTEHGQLVIKGMSPCNKICQSKPIVRKLSSISVESVGKDLYYIQGNIVDDEHELPEYVKGKFYNGFPDDWENVHQIWRIFVQQGCRASFRWPTPITDSDDDLKSELTDLTYQHFEDSKQEVSNLESSKKSQLSEPYSDFSLSASQWVNDGTFILNNCKKKDSFTQTSLIGVTENSFYHVDTDTPLNHYMCNGECNKNQENANVKYFHTKNKDKLKEKLNIILNNLLDKSSPTECINEIIEIAKFFNYLVSDEDNEFSTEDLKLKNYRNEHNKETTNKSGKSESISMINDVIHNKNTPSNSIINHKCISKEDKIINHDELLSKKRTFTEMSKDNDNDDSFENKNEVYAGVPRIPVEQLLRKREALKPHKRKIKKRAHEKYDVTYKPRVSNISLAEHYVDGSNSTQMNNIHFDDSSIDTKKYKRCFQSAKRRDSNSNIQSKMIKPIDFDITEVEQSNRLNNFNKSKNMHEVQKCFKRKNSTPIHKSINNFCNSFDEMKNEKSRSTLTGNCTNTENETNFNIREMSGGVDLNIRETNSAMEIINEKNDQHHNYTYCKSSTESLYHSTSKIAKPTIISSVPTNIEMRGFKTGYSLRKQKTVAAKNEDKDTKDLNKENETSNWIQKKSPTNFHATRQADATLLNNSKKDLEKHVEGQLANGDSTTLNVSPQSNLKTLKDNHQDTRYSKPKSLTAWIPKVLYKPKLSLIFKGTLLNDAGHVLHKNFQTKTVLRRVTAKLIETVDHEFYELIGDLNDTKHVIPKQLINHCRYGCPTRIDQFCKTWKSLQNISDDDSSDSTLDMNNSSTNVVNVGVSSKGRRIMRPLNYWTGERVTFKDDNPVYCPYTSFQEKLVDENTSDKKRIDSKVSKKFVTKHKKGKDVRTQESDHSSDSENVSPRKIERLIKQTPSNSVNINNKQAAHSTNIENSREPHPRLDESKLTKTSTKANLDISKQMFQRPKVSSGKRDVICTYYKGISSKDDVLSDDLESHV
ncbi:uncharacterized protein LOC117602409 isoform X1 [Osmia lignaria lignaria]|uniref:uncharacterized protein LOC117602409 isoform X1 n=1 Tax=Osmia lignaria lignaria TaxID=1437193 RepID=UPI00402BDF09